MGRELELNALPAQCLLLEQVARHEINGELLSLVPTYLRQRRQQQRRVYSFAQGDAEYERFVDAMESIVVSNPGIDQRHCDLGRRFEWLEWLLVRCAHDAVAQQLAIEAIRGEAPLSPVARSTQGFLIRFTPATRAVAISHWLQSVPLDQLRQQYDPEQMSNADLYKWDQMNQTADLFDIIARDFNALRRFYRDVSDHAEAVLVVMD